MDEECLRPGDTTDQTFLDKLSEMIGKHPHFISHSVADNSTRKTIKRDVGYPLKLFNERVICTSSQKCQVLLFNLKLLANPYFNGKMLPLSVERIVR